MKSHRAAKSPRRTADFAMSIPERTAISAPDFSTATPKFVCAFSLTMPTTPLTTRFSAAVSHMPSITASPSWVLILTRAGSFSEKRVGFQAGPSIGSGIYSFPRYFRLESRCAGKPSIPFSSMCLPNGACRSPEFTNGVTARCGHWKEWIGTAAIGGQRAIRVTQTALWISAKTAFSTPSIT